MSMTFDRPVGAAADVKELEYCAALIQTDDSNDSDWTNASIEARDIKHFLMSRYGIRVSKEQVKETILQDLGGGDSDDDCIDLTEVVAILLIPMLVKLRSGYTEAVKSREDFLTSREYKSYLADLEVIHELKPPPTIVADVLRIILLDATGSAEPQPLTKDLLRTIFAKYDELDLVQDDDLIEAMIEAAGGGDDGEAVGSGSGVDDEEGMEMMELNPETFLRALTSDVLLYDATNETKFTTHFEDVFGSDLTSASSSDANKKKNNIQDEDEPKEHMRPDGTATALPPPISFAFTFPSIDYTSETFSERMQVVVVWVSIVLGYFNFFFMVTVDEDQRDRLELCEADTFGCVVARGIWTWTIVMLSLCIIGTVCVATLNSGNNIFGARVYEVLIGVAGVGFFFFLPFFNNVDGFVLSTKKEKGVALITYALHFALGCIILLFQAKQLIRIFIPKDKLSSSKVLTALFTGSNAKAEYRIKHAAVYKVNNMVKNAYDLHHEKRVRFSSVTESGISTTAETSIVDENGQSSNALALMNFTKVSEERERVGGFVENWKRFIAGDISKREGIWFHTRIIAGNLAQLLISLCLLVVTAYVASQIINAIYPDDDSSSSSSAETEVESCTALFDADTCVYPNYEGVYFGFAVCEGVIASDGCDWYEVKDGGTASTACMNLALVLGTEFLANCSNVVFYQPSNDIWASELGSKSEDNYCAARVSTCAQPVSSDGFLTATCVLGTDGIFPFQFIGEQCDEYSDISALMEQVAPMTSFFNTAEEFFNTAEDTADDITPEKWMLSLSFSVGVIAAFFVGMSLTVVYIPSTISTILKFRSGVYPSLRDPNFKRYRTGLEGVTFILGIIFWGCFFSSVICLVIFGGVTFLLVWEPLREVVLGMIALVIGISVTLAFKSLLVIALGKVNYAAFYRKRPAIGNIANVALECWHLGLTSGYMLARTIKLITCAALFVGRIDIPFLGEGVGKIGPVDLDLFPTQFRKDLLSADAHRHPYIERLGVMYMMKLRHGSDFGKVSGSIWRLLFVFALMPWLRRYRVLDDAEIPDEVVLQTLALLGGSQRGLKDENAALKDEVENLKRELKESK